MAVIKDCRGQGIGSAMLEALLEHAREQGHTRVSLHAQFIAVSFYAGSGFAPSGGVFQEAGISHRDMLIWL